MDQIDLEVNRLREGSYISRPSSNQGARRRALTAVIREVYVHGVSTRAVKAMRASGVSKSQVSRLVREIDERVNASATRSRASGPYLSIDATYVKAREAARIVSTATIIAVGVNNDGRREVLGLAAGPSEAEAFWKGFLPSLADRGLRGVTEGQTRHRRRPQGIARGGENLPRHLGGMSRGLLKFS
jgi:transposase-like protein